MARTDKAVKEAAVIVKKNAAKIKQLKDEADVAKEKLRAWGKEDWNKKYGETVKLLDVVEIVFQNPVPKDLTSLDDVPDAAKKLYQKVVSFKPVENFYQKMLDEDVKEEDIEFKKNTPLVKAV